ncbi:unnamed protein product [Diplocarpon coronariae]|uniref:Uncharacterized protein n=1 Tax=Diplocarpon coronariae TaxID=2795749 RepID=A0A218Z447_9HELO|nr:hypothetical protein B2J93_3158 [Marssonina coronariae]
MRRPRQEYSPPWLLGRDHTLKRYDPLFQTRLSIDSKISEVLPRYTVYRREDPAPKTDARLAIAQLLEPAKAVPFPSSVPKGCCQNPAFMTPFPSPNTFTDLHIDTADGVISPLRECKKLWCVFPPTAKIPGLSKEAESGKAKLQRIGKGISKEGPSSAPILRERSTS